MRKSLYLLVAVPLFLCCKKDKTDAALPQTARDSAEVSVSDCDDLYAEMAELGDMQDVSKWLTENGHLICKNELEHCIEKFHKIETSILFETMAKRHPENATEIRFYPMELIEIENKIAEDGSKCYEKYIGFEFSGTNMELKLDTFKVSESFYSIPFIRGLRKVHNLGNSSTLRFTKSYEDDSRKVMKVIFMVEDNNGTPHYYDISHDPRKKAF